VVTHKVPKLCIVSRGLIGRLGRVLRKGAVFGEDLILNNRKLRKDVTTIAITYAEILSIDQPTFSKLVEQASPQDAAEVRWGVVKLSVIRGIPLLADQLWKDKASIPKFLNGERLDVPTAANKTDTPSKANGKDSEVVCGFKNDSSDVALQSHDHSATEILKQLQLMQQFQYEQFKQQEKLSTQQEKLSSEVQEVKRLLQALPGVKSAEGTEGIGFNGSRHNNRIDSVLN
jgi:hypothetical protein